MQGDSSDMLNVFLVFGLSCLVVSVQGAPSVFDTPGLADSSVGNVRPSSEVVPKTSGVEGQSFAPALLSDTGEQYLQLCECEEASGTPEGLSCAKQGWFLSNFEHEGRWLVGGGSVPLSKAICCRPCLPSQLVGDGSEKPIALVSVDCHASTNSGMKEVQCEADSSSFAVGFPSAVRVPGSLAFYPVGTTQCCTPAIITDKGSTLRLHRCGCDHELFSSSINCGNDLNHINTHRLLWGYSGARITQDGKYVPIAPALCCRLCLSQEPFDPTCATLRRCSHHGSCMFGSCHCDDGWTGADCSVRASSHGGVSLPPWMSGMIILVVCTLGSFLFLCLRYCWDEMRTRRLLHASSEGGQPLEALMLRMGVDDGSVGSVDTEGEELDDCDGSPSVGVVIDDYVLPGTQSAPGSAAGESPGASEAGAEAMPLLHSPQGERRAGVGLEEVEEPKGAAVVAAEEDPQDLKEKVARLSGSSPSPLQQVMCSICMERPVQVVLVPCGHAMVCRRCSRRLERCPFCRKDIARRQRVYVSD